MTGQLDEIVAAANRGKQEIISRREQLAEELRQVDEEMRRYDRILKAAGVETAKKNGGKKSEKNVAPDKLDLIADLFDQLPDSEELTIDDVAERTGLSHSTASVGLRVLRGEERVRLAGRKQLPPGQRGIGPVIYKRMPNGVGAS